MTVLTEWLPTARDDAETAARRAGVRITALHEMDHVRRIADVVESVWGTSVRPTPDILRALARAGGTLLAAEPAGDPGETVGGAVGFLGWDRGVHLHSHQVGVRPEWRHTGVGYALKLAQRAACLEHGITEMRWTFDPLLARNAGFNFGKLGTVGVAFLPDFYGDMVDSINSGDASDRFEVSWRLDEGVTPRLDEEPGSESRELVISDDGGAPHRTGEPPTAGVRVAIPADYAALRKAGEPVTRSWRRVTRAAFSECFDAGLIAVAFGPRGYVFDTEAT